jgi:hypothetical protein
MCRRKARKCVVVADRLASTVQTIAGRLGDDSVRVLGARTALEAIRHIEHEPAVALLIGSPAGAPDAEKLASLVAQRFPAVAVDRLRF